MRNDGITHDNYRAALAWFSRTYPARPVSAGTAMDEVYAAIAAGDFAADFGAIKGQAYSGG